MKPPRNARRGADSGPGRLRPVPLGADLQHEPGDPRGDQGQEDGPAASRAMDVPQSPPGPIGEDPVGAERGLVAVEIGRQVGVDHPRAGRVVPRLDRPEDPLRIDVRRRGDREQAPRVMDPDRERRRGRPVGRVLGLDPADVPERDDQRGLGQVQALLRDPALQRGGLGQPERDGEHGREDRQQAGIPGALPDADRDAGQDQGEHREPGRPPGAAKWRSFRAMSRTRGRRGCGRNGGRSAAPCSDPRGEHTRRRSPRGSGRACSAGRRGGRTRT